MNTIGYMANVSAQRSPLKTLSESVLYRAVIMDKILRRSYDTQLFIYNPCEIQDLDQPLVPGYLIEDKAFVPHQAPIPKINGNWLHRLRTQLDAGIGYNKFNQWRKQHNIDIYADFDFASMTYSKKRTFVVIEKFQPGLHPYTEALTNVEQQIENFMQRYGIVFLKPDQGNQGRGIIVVRKVAGQWQAKHHTHKKITIVEDINLEQLVKKITPFLNESTYIIQQGIDTLRYQGHPFSVRVTMVDDGKQWNFFDHILIGTTQGDLSYTPKDWEDAQPPIFFSKLYSQQQAQQIQQLIYQMSYELIEFLTKDFPGKVMELAYDFIIDTHQKIYLAELNTKPGMWNRVLLEDIFNVKDQETFIYLHQFVPHARACAEFLASKLVQGIDF